jgi:NAD-dependent protein deacetylase/lipoamidase
VERHVITAVDTLADAIAGADTVVALTGAGISVPSGIPDFRTPGTGLWANVDPMEVAHIDAWRRDPGRFWGFYAQRLSALGDVRPNGAHHALVDLQEAGHLDAVVTQNVDRLHRVAGTRDLIEVHGSIATASCLACGTQVPLDDVRALAASADDGIPRCACGEPLKPDVVLFGEFLPEAAIERAYALAAQADVLLCIGTSLEVHPVAQLPDITTAAGGQVALVTIGPTPWDDRALVKLDGDVVHELAALVTALRG